MRTLVGDVKPQSTVAAAMAFRELAQNGVSQLKTHRYVRNVCNNFGGRSRRDEHALQGSVSLRCHSCRADDRPTAGRTSARRMPMLVLPQAQCEGLLQSQSTGDIDGHRSTAPSTILVR